MDGRTQYSRLKNMLEDINGEIITMDELRGDIMMNITSNRNSVDQAVKLMFDLGLIVGIDATHVKIALKGVTSSNE